MQNANVESWTDDANNYFNSDGRTMQILKLGRTMQMLKVRRTNDANIESQTDE